MFKLFFILVIRLNLLIAPNVPDATSSGHQTSSILPLVLIRTLDGNFIRPTEILKSEKDDKGNLLFGTQFSAAKEGKQFFFCGWDSADENAAMEIDGEDDPDEQYYSFELPETQPELGSGSAAVATNYLQCPHEPKPFVLKLTEKNDVNEEKEVHCGNVFNQMSRMYAFVYKIKTNDDDETHIFEVYRFCYDEENGNVIYTEHIIASPKLLSIQNKSFEQERTREYEMSAKGYHYFGTRFQEIKNAYKQFVVRKDKKKWKKAMIEDSETTFMYLMSDEKLVPSDDMAFASWRNTTFHVLNAKLMEDSKKELWDHINKLIRKDAIDKSREYIVHTGVFDFTTEGKDENELMQSPDVWLKIVQYKNENEKLHEALAIVMIHNPKLAKVVQTFNNICKENECENAFAGNEKFIVIGTSVCCTASMESIDIHFDLKLDNVTPLKIDSLYLKAEEAPPAPVEVQYEEQADDGLYMSELSPD